MRVALVRAGALGDVVLLRRAVAALRGAGHDVVLVAPRGPGSALLGPGPSEVASLVPWDGREVAALLAGEAGPPALTVDAAVVYSRSADVARAFALAASRVLLHDPSPPAGTHAARWLCRPLADLGLSADAADPPILAPTEAERAAARPLAERLGPGFLAVHPGSGSPSKNWPASRFASVVDAVADERPWLLVEGPADDAASGPLRGRPGAVVAHHLPVRVLGALLGRAGLCVGNDSGVSHLAAAYGTRCVVLFGPSDPRQWTPDGTRVTAVRAPGGDLRALAVETVLAALSTPGS